MDEVLRLPTNDRAWMIYAACRGCDPDPFFPTGSAVSKTVKQLCAGCPVSEDCLEYALRHDLKRGIWGGKNERERAKIRRGRELLR